MSAHVKEFDYVIIGGGVGGLVTATRLTEDPNVSVVVLEAGGTLTDSSDTLIPGFAPQNLGHAERTWGFMMTPQAGLDGRVLPFFRGKAVGGSSAVNFMALGRGSSPEYDALESLGAPGWNWPEFLKYFRKSETFTFDPQVAAASGYVPDASTYGTSGPLKRSLVWTDPMHLKFFEALNELGVPSNPDTSNGNSVGTCLAPGAVDAKTATRSFAANAYYEPVKERRNLTVITGAQATRVLFEDGASGNLKATGVEYVTDGSTLVVNANREIILSGGSLSTPPLLELSGLGDETLLKGLGIPVRKHLPGVGNNLQDHAICTITAELDGKYDSMEVLYNPERAAQEFKLYQEEQRGLLAGVTTMGFAWVPTKYYMNDAEADAVVKAIGEYAEQEWKGGEKKSLEVDQGWIKDDRIPSLEMAHMPGFSPFAHAVRPTPGTHYFTIYAGVAHPISRGAVHIASKDPLAPPTINPNLLGHPADLKMIVAGLNYGRKIIKTRAMKGTLVKEVLPGAEVQDDKAMEEWAKKTTGNVNHPVGTAAMLPLEDGGVVDPELKVYGTENLRVVDASVLPFEIGAQIQSTVYALAEKAADIIKKST